MKRFKPAMRYDFAKGEFVANPTAPKRKKNTTTTNRLTNVIRSLIAENGGYSIRCNVSGFYREDVGYIRSGSTLGTPDIIAVVNGSFFGIEIKVGKDRQSPAQKTVQEGIKAAGGVYLLATDFDSFKAEFEAILKSF